MFEIPVGVNKCWNAGDTFKNKGSLLFRFKFLIKNAGYRGSLIILLTQGLFLSATLWDFRNIICKKMPHKIYVATSNGSQKNGPKDKYFFQNKVFENRTDNSTDLMATL